MFGLGDTATLSYLGDKAPGYASAVGISGVAPPLKQRLAGYQLGLIQEIKHPCRLALVLTVFDRIVSVHLSQK